MPLPEAEYNASTRHAFDRHSVSADALLQEYYTQEVGDLVYKLYKRDFEFFGYARQMFESSTQRRLPQVDGIVRSTGVAEQAAAFLGARQRGVPGCSTNDFCQFSDVAGSCSGMLPQM